MSTVLITGANRGLGLEFVRQYAAAGWTVLAACRRPAEFPRPPAGAIEVLGLDVADFAGVAALAEHLRGRPLDVLLNNAGLYGEHQEFGNIDPGDWERVLRTNAIAPLKVAEAFLPHVLAGRNKTMAFMTSRMGSIADNEAGGAYIYRSSKAALNAAVKSLSIDLRPRGVTAILLHPGWVKTDMGGPGAAIEPPESVAGLRRVIAGAGPQQSGGFFDYTGASVPW